MKHGVFRLGLLISTLLPVALAGCVPPAPGPAAETSAAIGISLENRWETAGWFGNIPEWVHLVRWSEDGDVTNQTEVVTSNFQRGNRAYLLNAKPGRYSAIASSEVSAIASDDALVASRAGSRPQLASWRGGGAQSLAKRDNGDDNGADEVFIETTYFSRDMIRNSTVEAVPGTITFMGDYVVVRDRAISQGDGAQRHFHPLENPKLLDYLGMEVIQTQVSASRSVELEFRRDKDAELKFLSAALVDLGGTGWESAVRRSLRSLQRN